MADTAPQPDQQSLITRFRTSDHWAASLARDLLWVVAVVGSIALLLWLICGTWPAVVTIESGSMIPNMNIGDLVVVVEEDRFGNLQTWDDGKASGYKKFNDYGDVIIYRPNGYTDFWATIGLLPLTNQHPIIHRAMTTVDAGEPVPLYLNPYRGTVTPAGYLPLSIGRVTTDGYLVLTTTGSRGQDNVTIAANDLTLTIGPDRYVLPAGTIVKNSGYVWNSSTTTSHGGYITKGDNNPASDQGTLKIGTVGTVEPVEKDWIIGKALFTVPYVGLLPLHIVPVIIVVIILMAVHELWLRRRENALNKPQKKGKKQR